ncbi:diacylglycerol kinase family protein [Aureibacter tunicatorum]|uniref:Undecaprenol kinase/diacylglycerol kinase (ATP) n=1 Tax=Aureibacter tunicatorum TaxID=866807 RepID=A0AAE3XQ57_9BACT|nr:undecaprenol kinase/diacylglycerol kinase (ATP) [Aureibacter tunicatorum]BDD04371.1 diacylglycerol kinase [Aureibacter tunicatorum]
MKKKFKISSRINSFKYAFNGIKIMFKSEHNFWIHIAATFLVISLGLYLTLTPIEWCIILLCIGLVISLEMVNSSIERICNLISLERNKEIESIKDIAAGAVLVSSIVSFIIGALIILPKIFRLLPF